MHIRLTRTAAYLTLISSLILFFTSTSPSAHASIETIPNPSLEEVGENNRPIGWKPSRYGENLPVFAYIEGDGHDGDRSVKVTMREHTSGDAKWEYEAQSVEGGSDYLFSAWYKSNITPNVVVEYTREDGTKMHYGLPKAEPSTDEWRHYEAEFNVPERAVTATVFFFIDEEGWVQTDDYSISSFAYEGFDRPIVTLTFDDGSRQNIDTVLPLFDELGFKSTHCYMTEPLEGNTKERDRVLEFFEHGHEICSHSVSHPNFTKLSPEELTYELTHSRAYLEKITGEPIVNVAAPFGAYNQNVLDEMRKYYYIHRSVNEGYNAKNNLQPYRLKVQNMLIGTTLEEFQGWVQKAMEENLWLILVYHKVDYDHISTYDTYGEDFESQMRWLQSTGVPIMRLDEAFAEVLPQTNLDHDPILEDVTERGFFVNLRSLWKKITYFLTHP